MCNFCGKADGCRMEHGNFSQYQFEADDWKKLYDFMRYIYLPFMHSLIMTVQRRKGITYTPEGKPKKYESANKETL